MRIVKIISIVDTREYEEIADGVFRAVPGSGTESICSRCGRAHEVHATVQLEDGAHVVVGTGCAAKESADLAKRFRTGEAAAKKIKQLCSKREQLVAMRDRYVAAEVAAASAIVPAAKLTERKLGDRMTKCVVVDDGKHAGYAYIGLWREYEDGKLPAHELEERTTLAVKNWREAIVQELLGATALQLATHQLAGERLAALDDEITKTAKRLAAIQGAA